MSCCWDGEHIKLSSALHLLDRTLGDPASGGGGEAPRCMGHVMHLIVRDADAWIRLSSPRSPPSLAVTASSCPALTSGVAEPLRKYTTSKSPSS